MYFVVECNTISAPSVSGCCSAGEAKVLSTKSFAPARRGDLGNPGDIGDRQQRVGGCLDPDQLRLIGDRGRDGIQIGQCHRRCSRIPHWLNTLSISRKVPP